jgi:hypothetical protein
MKNIRNLAGSKVRVDEDFSRETRRMRIPKRSGVKKLS